MKKIDNYLRYLYLKEDEGGSEEEEKVIIDPRLKGTQTEKNLASAFSGESQVRNKYTYFASQAKKDGYEQIAGIFEETANHEREHAKRFYSYLSSDQIYINDEMPIDKIGTTLENLESAAKGEHYEYSTKYLEFANIAEKEGFSEIATLFREVSVAERFHERRYLALAANISNNRVFKRDKPVSWKCRNCGYTYYGNEAPSPCPSCKHPQGFYEVMEENY